MSIHAMPDLCLVTIFCRVPLRDRIRAGQVCTRWRSLRSAATLRVRSLAILVGPNASRLVVNSKFNYPALLYHVRKADGTGLLESEKVSNWNSLQFSSFDDETMIGLGTMFRNVRTFKLALDKVDMRQFLFAVCMSKAYATKLVTLKIYCSFAVFDICLPTLVSQNLFDTINSLSALKHLTLEFNTNFALSRFNIIRGYEYNADLETTSVDMPIIAQLDEFNFYSPDDERGDVMFNSFQRYVQPSKRPLKIQFGYHDQTNHLAKLTQLGPQFCRRVGLLVFCDSYHISTDHELTEFECICARFSSITRISVSVENITIRDFIKNLSQLTQLAHLRLDVWFDDIIEEEEPSNDIYRQLPSVKSLDLRFCSTNHENISELNIPWTLPNVQVMELMLFTEVNSCDICEYNRDEDDVVIPLDRLKHCYSQIWSQIQVHLSKCSQLHTVTEFVAEPFKAVKSPITKQDLVEKIVLEINLG